MRKTKNKPFAGSPKKTSTKISKVIKLLDRKSGATLEQMMQATGWQKRTVRFALTGLRKKGQTIERSLADGASHYMMSRESDQ